MTGAPKRRSCEILARIEGAGRPRGVYSGVLGYLDVGGAGDFAVVIRTACRWDPHSPPSSTGNGGGETGEEREAERGQEWCVGAGGAITALSDAADEWVEMLTKLNAVLGAVGVQVG
jgi:para-aminobenzoate synthetase